MFKNDVFDPELKFVFEEANGEVDGQHIIGKVRGQFFVPDGKSRNGRYYTRGLWERAINDANVNSNLEKRLMFGTVGHDGELDDKAVREGAVSHIMTKLEIDGDNRGIGEALILGTPAGKILNTMLRAGAQLSVSSRAQGTFKGKHEGMPMVNPDDYVLETFDFVVRPGFLEAKPSLEENLKHELENLNKKDNNVINNKGDNSMDTKLVEHIANENTELKEKLNKVSEEIESLKVSNETIVDENTHLKGEVEKKNEELKVVESYTALGTVEEISEKLESNKVNSEILEKFTALADTPEECEKTITDAMALISNFQENLGTYDEIKSSLEEAIELKEAIVGFGGVDEIKSVFDIAETLCNEKDEKELAEKVKTLANDTKLSEEKVTELLSKYEEADIRDLYNAVSESKPVEEGTKTTVKVTEDEDGELSFIRKSRAERIAERFQSM